MAVMWAWIRCVPFIAASVLLALAMSCRKEPRKPEFVDLRTLPSPKLDGAKQTPMGAEVIRLKTEMIVEPELERPPPMGAELRRVQGSAHVLSVEPQPMASPPPMGAEALRLREH